MVDPELYKKANTIIQKMYKYYFLKDSNKNPGQMHNHLVGIYEQQLRAFNEMQENIAEYQSVRRQLDRYNYNLSNEILTRNEDEETPTIRDDEDDE